MATLTFDELVRARQACARGEPVNYTKAQINAGHKVRGK